MRLIKGFNRHRHDKGLRSLQWNGDYLSQKQHELRLRLTVDNINICFISELLPKFITLSFPRMCVIRVDWTMNQGGDKFTFIQDGLEL